MSPLGKYSQQVAAIVAVLVILAAVAARFFVGGDPWLEDLAMIAIGAVFGASAATAVNGGAIKAAHRRLDLISAPPGQIYEDHPDEQAITGAIRVERHHSGTYQESGETGSRGATSSPASGGPTDPAEPDRPL